MELHRLAKDDDAVSQVVAIVLLVAVVIVLAAVVGPVVLGVGQSMTEGNPPAPQAQFDWTYDEGASNLTLKHDGGETIDKETLRIVGSESGELSPSWSDGDGKVTVGDTAEFTGVQPDETVRVFWSDPDADKQYQIARWVGPEDSPPDS